MNKTILVGADIQKNGISYSIPTLSELEKKNKYPFDNVPHLMGPLKALMDDNIKSIKVYKPQSQSCTFVSAGYKASIIKAVQCGYSESRASRAKLNFMYHDFMLSDINKKRLPDYVKKSLEGLGL